MPQMTSAQTTQLRPHLPIARLAGAACIAMLAVDAPPALATHGPSEATSSMDVPSASMRVSPEEQAQLSRINRYRVNHGRSRLTLDRRLARSANWMSIDMARGHYFSHTDSRDRSPFGRIAAAGFPSDTWRGENLAAGNKGAEATFQQWRTSTGHRLNMLNRHYRVVGIAQVHAEGSDYGWYWTTNFGS